MMTRPLGDCSKIETFYAGIGLTAYGLLMLLWVIIDTLIVTPLARMFRLIRKVASSSA